jgi:hypothetical protein
LHGEVLAGVRARDALKINCGFIVNRDWGGVEVENAMLWYCASDVQGARL